jgi:hypothetical protein
VRGNVKAAGQDHDQLAKKSSGGFPTIGGDEKILRSAVKILDDACCAQ